MVNFEINLLPWRQKRRDRLQREFLNGLAAMALAAVFLLVGSWRVYQSEIGTQNARNAYLANEIEGLDSRIVEINVLQKKRKELLDRMRVIQELQGNRPVSVRLFDELARQLSDSVFFERLSLDQERILITGIAEDNNRISSQLRNFERSSWFTAANVTSIDAFPQAGPEASRFSLTVELSAPRAE